MSSSLTDLMASGRVLVMDGAMGTQLQRLGLRIPPQRCEDWNLERPDAVRAVHRAYAEAGAEMLQTNTFQANPVALAERELRRPGFLAQTFGAAAGLAAECAGPGRLVLADIGPIVGPDGAPSANQDDMDAVIDLAAQSRCAGILLETYPTEQALVTARRARQAGVPVLLSICFRKRAEAYESFDGHAPEWFAERAEAAGAAALGTNCGPEIGVADCAAIVRRYRGATGLPLFARPNAGTPVRDGDAWIYPRSPAAMAAEVPELLEAGASMVGGCCGTTPAHIAAFRAVVDDWNTRHIR